jgi:hypothetical protein
LADIDEELVNASTAWDEIAVNESVEAAEPLLSSSLVASPANETSCSIRSFRERYLAAAFFSSSLSKFFGPILGQVYTYI